MAVPTLRFERLAEHHLEAVVAIEKIANGSPWSDRGFRNEIDHPHGVFLVALEAGEVVGYGGIWLVIDEAHIVNLAVREDRRRCGIARELTKRLLAAAKDGGMKTASLEVRAGNTGAIRLYEDLGFVITNTRKRYYPDNREDALVMWLFTL